MPRYREFRLRNERYEKPAGEAEAETRKGAEGQETDFAAREAEWKAIQWEIVRALEDFPDAKAAVAAALERGKKRE